MWINEGPQLDLNHLKTMYKNGVLIISYPNNKKTENLILALRCLYKNLYIYLLFVIFEKNINMQVTTYTNFRQQLKSYLDKVRNNHTPLYVTSANGDDVVVLSKSDYESMEETFYLLKNPNNAARLLKGIEEYEKGLGKERSLIEE